MKGLGVGQAVEDKYNELKGKLSFDKHKHKSGQYQPSRKPKFCPYCGGKHGSCRCGYGSKTFKRRLKM